MTHFAVSVDVLRPTQCSALFGFQVPLPVLEKNVVLAGSLVPLALPLTDARLRHGFLLLIAFLGLTLQFDEL